VVVSGDAMRGAAGDPILLGVLVGLLGGKVVGVTAGAWLAVRLGIGRLPAHTTWRHVIGLGLLAGVGFTVALFVAALSFTDPANLDSAKIGIFAGSLLAGVAGYVWLRRIPEVDTRPDEARVAGALAH
jgi:Na+:H+ antiporter, NhaA family